MIHVILGHGNLGDSLAKAVRARGDEVFIRTASTGWTYPDGNIGDVLRLPFQIKPDHVWCTVGAGSVAQAKEDYKPFVDLHIKLPMDLAQRLPPATNLHLFTTDYCAEEPRFQARSLYALSKQHMEDAILMLGRPHTNIYRVGSLYGSFKPESCFPYKLLKNVKAGGKEVISLPTNCVSPTPTDWLAEQILSTALCPTCEGSGVQPRPNISGLTHICPTCNGSQALGVKYVHPKGCCSVAEWGRRVLGDLCRVLDGDLDLERPVVCSHDQRYESSDVSWLELWKKYGVVKDAVS